MIRRLWHRLRGHHYPGGAWVVDVRRTPEGDEWRKRRSCWTCRKSWGRWYPYKPIGRFAA